MHPLLTAPLVAGPSQHWDQDYDNYGNQGYGNYGNYGYNNQGYGGYGGGYDYSGYNNYYGGYGDYDSESCFWNRERERDVKSGLFLLCNGNVVNVFYKCPFRSGGRIRQVAAARRSPEQLQTVLTSRHGTHLFQEGTRQPRLRTAGHSQ